MEITVSGSSPSFVTGVDIYEDGFVWKIKNVTEAMNSGLTNSQRIKFDAWKENQKLHSKWGFKVVQHEHVKASIALHELPSTVDVTKAKVQFLIEILSGDCSINDQRIKETGTYSVELIKKTIITRLFLTPNTPSHLINSDGSFIMKWTIKMCLATESVFPYVDNFQEKAASKAADEILKVMEQNQKDDVKVVAMDGVVFTANRTVLSARSPVFGAMFQYNMNEKQTGVIKMTDIESGPLKVLLRFIASGKLLPEWNSKETFLGLVYAAHKYQLADLVKFLEDNFGKFCDLENCGECLHIAQKLSLKIAEEHVLKFILAKRADPFKNLGKWMKLGENEN